VLRARTKTISIIGSFAVAGLLLTGCAGGQSKADACNELNKSVESLQDELTSSVSNLSSDPSAASDAIDKLAKSFSESTGKVTNDEVKPSADKANKAITSMADEFGKYADDPTAADPTALSESATDVQTTFSDLATLCN
jgi:ABC-type glycerol-3-phosphate transport system substrate-binding protein